MWGGAGCGGVRRRLDRLTPACASAAPGGAKAPGHPPSPPVPFVSISISIPERGAARAVRVRVRASRAWVWVCLQAPAVECRMRGRSRRFDFDCTGRAGVRCGLQVRASAVAAACSASVGCGCGVRGAGRASRCAGCGRVHTRIGESAAWPAVHGACRIADRGIEIETTRPAADHVLLLTGGSGGRLLVDRGGCLDIETKRRDHA